MASIALVLLLFLPIFLVLGGLLVLRYFDKRSARRLPIDVSGLPNLPGTQVRAQLEDAGDDYWTIASLAQFAGPMIPLVLLWVAVRSQAQELTDRLYEWVWLYVSIVALVVGALLVLARRQILKLRRCREGLAAELATAHGLQSLIPEGLFVFHDLPADGFNIDHVVVGKSVVFAIETKSRKKPVAMGKASARVRYDGKALHFPDHVATKPLEQAARQARWLAEQLSGATGNPVRVIPVVALPGWFVEQTVSPTSAKDEVRVINPKNPAFMHKLNFGPAMADDQRRRIAWALNKRYGDMAED